MSLGAIEKSFVETARNAYYSLRYHLQAQDEGYSHLQIRGKGQQMFGKALTRAKDQLASELDNSLFNSDDDTVTSKKYEHGVFTVKWFLVLDPHSSDAQWVAHSGEVHPGDEVYGATVGHKVCSSEEAMTHILAGLDESVAAFDPLPAALEDDAVFSRIDKQRGNLNKSGRCGIPITFVYKRVPWVLHVKLARIPLVETDAVALSPVKQASHDGLAALKAKHDRKRERK